MPQNVNMEHLNEPIAIVGSSCRFAGGVNSTAKLWDLLKDPHDVSSEIGTGSRFNDRRFYHQDSGHNGTTSAQRAYVLSENVRHFDAKFFSIQPGEAEAIDPQQRMLLEVIYEGLENAGLTINRLSGSNTACYVGIMCQDWSMVQSQDILSIPKYAATGIAMSNASSRVSYFFDWHGPSMTLDTACSSSMVCVYQAVEALRNGTSEVAVACGTNLLLAPFMYISLSNVNMASPTGRCHMWDEKADGYGRGEGVGCLVLKKLSAAVRDGDQIVCVIREIGVNHDGKTRGLTMPSAIAQASLIQETYKRAGLDPTKRSDRCQYFEAHGTGTPIGDPQESQALDKAFFPNHSDAEGELVCGSIKTIIGHTEGCAGIAGILKASLALQSSVIPANLLFNKLNPALKPFTKYLRIPTSCEKWPDVPEGQPRRASVNSFGFGGANAHCILESYESGPPPKSELGKGHAAEEVYTNGTEKTDADVEDTDADPININGVNGLTNHIAKSTTNDVLNGDSTSNGVPMVSEPSGEIPATPNPTLIPFTFSSASVNSLVSLLESLQGYIEENPHVDLPSLAYTLSARRTALRLRGAIYASSAEELSSRIREKLDTSVSDVSTQHSVAALTAAPSVLGIFTGQGAQWQGMASKLWATIPLAQKIITDLDDSLASLPECHRPAWTLSSALQPESKQNTSEAAISQPLCTAVQIVLVDLLKAAGVQFRAVVGHSSGEIAAAYAAGFLRASDAIRIAYYRGYFAKLAAGPQGEKGGMIAAGTRFEDAEELCQVDDMAGRLTVAAHNSPTSVTLSGDADAIDLAKDVFEEESKFARVLRVDTAYHSPHMLRCVGPYAKALGDLKIQTVRPEGDDAPQWYSSVYNLKVDADTRGIDGQYWVDNLTRPVLFYPALRTCLESVSQPFNFAIEVGPHPALQGPAKESIQAVTGQDIAYSGTLKRGLNDIEAFADALGTIWAHFGPDFVDLARFQQSCRPDVEMDFLHGLPPYPWAHETEFWVESRRNKVFHHHPEKFHDLLGLREPDGIVDEARWRHAFNLHDMPWMSGHKLQGQVVFPATGYICMISEAALSVATNQPVEAIDIFNLEIRKAIAVYDDRATDVILSFTKIAPSVPSASTEAITADFTIFSVAGRDSNQMTLNCCGKLHISLGSDYTARFPPRSSTEVSMIPVDVDRFYSAMKEEIGLGFEEAFRSLTSIKRRGGRSIVTARNPPFAETETKLLFHPAMLDCGMQGLNVAFAAPGDGTLSELVAPTHIQRITLLPQLLKEERTDEVIIESTNTGVRGLTPTGDVDIYTSGFGRKLIEMEGILISPIAPPTAEDDIPLFQKSIKCPDKLDAKLARAGKRMTMKEKILSYEAERVAFYYIRQLFQNTSLETREKLPRYRQCLLNECERVYHQVQEGRHSFASGWGDDTKDFIEEILDRYDVDDPDLAIIRAVGENILNEKVLTGEVNILELITRDNLLERFYTEAVGYPILNAVGANLIKQLTRKFPCMNILEIGAGTGSSTAVILDCIGEAYASYMYTDISRGFFGLAGDKFQAHSHKMDFQTLDITKDPSTQGFEPQTYDVVIAQNVLHATTPLKESLRNARRLLKPGGYLINMELVLSDAMRFTLVFGCLPGWWVGEAEGRTRGPLLSHDGWKEILAETGFAFETISEQLGPEDPWAVMAARAVDDRIAPILTPLSVTEDLPEKEGEAAGHLPKLLVVGGTSPGPLKIYEETLSIVEPFFQGGVTHIDNLTGLDSHSEPPEGQHILFLTELDTNLWENINESVFKNLKRVIANAASVLWLLQGSQESNPYAGATIGFLRTVHYELPDTKFQALDIGADIGKLDIKVLAECLVRLKGQAEMGARHELDGVLNTVEPELYLMDGRLNISRLICNDDQNERYNSAKRAITRPVEVTKSNIPISLVWNDKPRMGVKDFKGAYELREEYKLETTEKQKSNGGRVTIRVSCSLLSSLKTPAGFFFVCIGTNVKTGVKTLCFADRQATIVTVPESWTVPLHDGTALDDVGLMSFFIVDLLAEWVLQVAPVNGSVVLFDGNPVARALLTKRLRDTGKRVALVTSKYDDANGADVHYLHPNSAKRFLDAALPSDAALFIDASNKGSSASEKLGQRIAAALPSLCEKIKLSSALAREASVLPSTCPESISRLLQGAASFAFTFSQLGPMPMKNSAPLDVMPLVQALSPTTSNADTLVLWHANKHVPVSVEPVYMRQDLVRLDRTYWLAGLSGTLGQSLADFLVIQGARYIAISSRSPKAEAEWVDFHKKNGVTIAFFSGDITDFRSVRRVYSEIRTAMPPITGVASGAMVLKDSSFMAQEFEDWLAITRPKMSGIVNLDNLFRQHIEVYEEPLDWFVGFSSLVAYTGNPGQSAYGAGNAFLKALIRSRHSSGFAGSTIDIGRMVGVGYIEGQLTFEAQERFKIRSGTLSMSESDLHQLFAEAIVAGRPGSGMDTELIAGLRTMKGDDAQNTFWGNNPRLSTMIRPIGNRGDAGGAGGSQGVPLKKLLKAAKSPKDATKIITGSLKRKLQGMKFLPDTDAQHDTTSLIDLGMDSLIAVFIRSWFQNELGVDIPVMKMLGGASIADLVESAIEKLSPDLVGGTEKSEKPQTNGAATNGHSAPAEEQSTVEKVLELPQKVSSLTNGAVNGQMDGSLPILSKT